MPQFTETQMLDELREILLLQAELIRRAANDEIAEQFIGLRSPGPHGYAEQEPSRVDLSRFKIGQHFEEAYDYVFQPSFLHPLSTSAVEELSVFMIGIPKIEEQGDNREELLVNSGIVHNRYMTPDGCCQIVADAAFARWKLDVLESGDFTPRELALLANMTEGAVRNAMSEKGDNRLKPIPGLKPIRVEHNEARQWLVGRRGFSPRPQSPRHDAVLHKQLADVRTVKEFSRFLDRYHASNIALRPEMGQALGRVVTDDEFIAWIDEGTFVFDADKARRIAEALDLDVPSFVGKALEVSLRRDSGVTDGGQA